MRLSLVLLAACTLTAADPVASVVMLKACTPLPAEVPFDVKPMGMETGWAMAFLIQGEDLVAVKEDSLEVTTLTLAGKDVANSHSGKPTWEIGSFPKASEDGKYASFTIEGQDALIGRVDQLALTGTIVVKVGGELVTTASTPLSPGDAAVTLAGFTVSVDKSEGKKGMFGGDGQGVTVSGPLDDIAEITLTADGKKVDSQGWSGGGDNRTYNFAKTAGKLVVTLKTWKDLKEVTVPLAFGKAAAPAKK